MSIERAFLVRMGLDDNGVAELLADIRSAKQRIPKALPGDRVEVVRFEALSAQLEDRARRKLASGDASTIEVPLRDRECGAVVDPADLVDQPEIATEVSAWAIAGDLAVEVRMALCPGFTEAPPTVGMPIMEPAASWKAPLDDQGHQLTGTMAVAARFRFQLRNAVDLVPGAAMLPSGVSNRVLTNELRTFVGSGDGPRRDVPVKYRDGSVGPPFPMRCLRFDEVFPEGWRRYNFAMLSMRHTEMDVAVDGAWLRNTDISRPRPAADTDQIAYEYSKRQLEKLCGAEPIQIHLYQTGLDAVVVGFYRAVTHYLIQHPRSLAVIPMYFRRHADGSVQRSLGGYEQNASFEEGKPWVVQTNR